MRRVYLDIDIGDPAAHAAAAAAYDRTLSFLAAGGGARVGLAADASLADVDADTAALIADAYASDPTWAAKGTPAISPPRPLRAGRLVIELFNDAAPRAAANFEALCVGPSPPPSSGPLLHYADVIFHRIVAGFVCQGGDVVFGRGVAPDPRRVGSGAVSIYNGKPFKDEAGGLKLKHDRGTVAMSNSGKNGNACQFYFVLGKAADSPSIRALDGKHVVVGRVVEDADGVLDRIEAEAASTDGTPKVRVAVSACGVVE